LQLVIDFDNASIVRDIIYLPALLRDFVAALQKYTLVVRSLSIMTITAREL